MGDKSHIEWTDATWNPVRGCSLVSAGCTNCYAMHQAHRQNYKKPSPFKGEGKGEGAYYGLTRLTEHGPVWTGDVRLVPELLDLPLRWKKPRRIFVNSMSDLFHEKVPDGFIDKVFEVMESGGCSYDGKSWSHHPVHTFQVLTKRPQRMLQYMTARGAKKKEYSEKFKHCPTPEMRDSPAAIWARQAAQGDFYKNVQLGVSVEDQPTADERIPLLLQTPAAVRWISAEPLLGAIQLNIPTRIWGALSNGKPGCDHCCTGDRCDDRTHKDRKQCPYCHGTGAAIKLDWVVVGGESGPRARPMHPDWARSLRDQCNIAGVPFFFKQWGKWLPRIGSDDPDGFGHPLWTDGRFGDHCTWKPGPHMHGSALMYHVGKKRAGRLLDGREWNEMPVITRGGAEPIEAHNLDPACSTPAPATKEG